MTGTRRHFATLMLLLLALSAATLQAAKKGKGQTAPGRWPVEKAQAWGAKQPWLVGCNFIPSTAINELEMWQAETFDPATIDRELGWAEGLGMNTVRTFLHDRAWEADKDGFKKRIDQFLAIAAKHKIRPMLVLFDDCWNEGAKTGPQPTPKPGVHNSGWLQAPGIAIVNDPAQWGRLEAYAKDIVGTFAQDERILLWDVYNEPGNTKNEVKSLPFLKKVFEWARAAKPSQPLTAGTWNAAPGYKELNAFQLANSDVITFHNYVSVEELKAEIAQLKKLGRPVICTEYMARTHGSTFQTHLPVFKAEGVGALNWGLVAGKTNTIFSWRQVGPLPEPPLWFHDIFRPDGKPYNPDEVKVIRELTGAKPM